VILPPLVYPGETSQLLCSTDELKFYKLDTELSQTRSGSNDFRPVKLGNDSGGELWVQYYETFYARNLPMFVIS
jgi:hypothetical protein